MKTTPQPPLFASLPSAPQPPKPSFRHRALSYLPIVLTLIVALGMMLVTGFFSMQASSSMNTTATPLAASEECLTPNEKFFAPVINDLRSQGGDSAFIKMIVNDPRTAFNETLVKINVIGTKKKADYSHNTTDAATRAVREFMQKHDSIFTLAEKKYGVPREVISALLFVETKHGNNTGMHHVASVYLSVAMCNQQEYIDKNKQALREQFEGSAEELQALEAKIDERAQKKAKWALKELLAMQQMSKLSPKPVLALYGSWAGAFGIPQFLPSSYIRSAVDGDGDGRINLFEITDAIFSVGNYLKTANWGESTERQRKALYAYNNSDDYVSAILSLARRASDDNDPALQKKTDANTAKSSAAKTSKRRTAAHTAKRSHTKKHHSAKR
jgi:membrane-bound lytic murein transglycosylase B